MRDTRILLAGAILLALFATVALAAKAPCTGATGTLCKKQMMKGDQKITIIEVKGYVGASNQGPCKTTIKSANGSVTTSGRGRSSRCGTPASGNGNTVYTATVEGSNCGPTRTDRKKESAIPDC